MSNGFRSGFVAIVGKPNVGKSTLMNALIGEKVSIVTPKAQTTRNRITGILTTEKYQIIFIDTPGIINPSYKLQSYMLKSALNSASEADLILVMIDVWEEPEKFKTEIFNRIKDLKKDKILVINKIDKIKDKSILLPKMDLFSKEFGFHEIVPISALVRDGLDILLDTILKYLPIGGAYYPEDQISDLPERFFVAEIIREKIFMYTQQEVPYSTSVQVNEFKQRENGKIYISATIYVERDNQKAIMIGKNGSMLKKIGQDSRKEIEAWLNTQVYLDLWVSVRENWRNKDSFIKEFGYE